VAIAASQIADDGWMIPIPMRRVSGGTGKKIASENDVSARASADQSLSENPTIHSDSSPNKLVISW
jgi:hypothetical protein